MGIAANRAIKVALNTYYLTPDKSRAVRRGDPDASGGSLLVRKGSPIEESVAEHYGIETEDGQHTNVVRQPIGGADRTVGVGEEAEVGYRRIEAARKVNDNLRDAQSRAGDAGGSRQLAMLGEGQINKELAPHLETDPQEMAGRMRTADGSGGQGGAPLKPGAGAALQDEATGKAGGSPAPNMRDGSVVDESTGETLTERLEREEREATARNTAGASARTIEAKAETGEGKATNSRSKTVGGAKKGAGKGAQGSRS